jgi:hypothetical protein
VAGDDTPPAPQHAASDPPADDQTRILRRDPLSTGPQPADTSEPKTGIIRRTPTGSIPVVADPPTGIIRRTPTGSIPVAADPPTGYIPRTPTGSTPVSDAATGFIPRAAAAPSSAASSPAPSRSATPTAAIATSVASILSGWATGVIATDLITNWWGTDLLFCIAMGFLTAISAAAGITGLIALLLRRRTARLLVVVGAVVALLIFAGLFIAGAKLPPAVYFIPVLPVATIVLAALPATARWERSA